MNGFFDKFKSGFRSDKKRTFLFGSHPKLFRELRFFARNINHRVGHSRFLTTPDSNLRSNYNWHGRVRKTGPLKTEHFCVSEEGWELLVEENSD